MIASVTLLTFRQCPASIYHNVWVFVHHSVTLVSLNAGTGEATLRCKDCDWLTWFMRAFFLILSLVRKSLQYKHKVTCGEFIGVLNNWTCAVQFPRLSQNALF